MFDLSDDLASLPTAVHLNARQKNLLTKLVGFILEGKLKEPIVPFPLRHPSTHYTLHLRGEKSFKFKRISDMDTLCDADYLSFRWNRIGTTKLYTVTKAGFYAVKNNFQAGPALYGTNSNLQEIMTAMSGGAVQIPELDSSLDVTQIALHPILRHDHVNLLIRVLLAEAEAALPWKIFVVYNREAEAFQEELLKATPNVTSLKQLAAKLTLTEQLAGPFSFTLIAWTLVYPLLLIGSIRHGNASNP